MRLKLDANPTRIIVRYEYSIRDDSSGVYPVCIEFIDGKFNKCIFDFGSGNYTREMWKILAEIESLITELEDEIMRKNNVE